MNKELFKNIKEYPYYWISPSGQIWNNRTHRMIKPSQKPNGYYQVNLECLDGRRKKEYIHRLVALTYLDNPNGYPEVHHKDNNPTNNDVSNLQWVTRSENCRNKTDNRKVNIYDLNDNLLYTCGTVAEAIEKTGVSQASIYAVLRGDFDSCKGFKFKNWRI